MLSRSKYEMKECEVFFINGKVGRKSRKKVANKNVEIEGISMQSSLHQHEHIAYKGHKQTLTLMLVSVKFWTWIHSQSTNEGSKKES